MMKKYNWILGGLMAMAIGDLGQSAVSLTGWQAGIQTDSVHGNAVIMAVETGRIRQELEAGNVVVVAGFQGIGPNGDITTLGRGGSDTSAVALAAALHADLCQIFTDVDGIYTADPKLDPNAVKYDHISYDEVLAQHLAVMDTTATSLSMDNKIPVIVFALKDPENIIRVVLGEDIGTKVN